MDPSLFEREYENLNLFKTADPKLRRAQLGSLCAIASHFTRSDENAIISLPTGSGKTLIALLAPYILKARRLLLVTPSRILRNQVFKDFRSMKLPRKLRILPSGSPKPNVKRVLKRISESGQWKELLPFDVVIATPHVVSPAYEAIPDPPQDLFDVVIVDEAHHAPARTWKGLLDSFPSSKCILLTATPYRRDRKEIPGKLVYDYPLSQAMSDGIYDPISYVPSFPVQDNRDLGLVATAKANLDLERAQGLDGAILIRTDRISEAERLRELYTDAHITVEIVHSRRLRDSQRAIKALQEGRLDGLICVDMLGEGFDVPRLKIAVLHSPHRSLPATLQFVGRLSRTGGPKTGPARVIAIPTSNPEAKTPEGDLLRLFQEDANWQKLIPDLAKGALESETKLKEFFSAFTYEGIETLSARSLRPRFKAVLFDIEDEDFEIDATPDLTSAGQVIFEALEPELHCAVWITAQSARPAWLATDEIILTDAALHIAHLNVRHSLLFIQSETDHLVESIRDSVCPGAQRVNPEILDALLRDENVAEVFNIGISNVAPRAARRAEYTIYAGNQADGAIRPNEVRRSTLGHASARVFHGSPSDSEVRGASMRSASAWSSKSGNLLDFIDWCDSLGAIMRGSGPSPGYRSPVGLLSYGTEHPPRGVHPIAVSWHPDVYRNLSPIELVQRADEVTRYVLVECELNAGIHPENPDCLDISLVTDSGEFYVADYFRFEKERWFRLPAQQRSDLWSIEIPSDWLPRELSLIDYLNSHPPKVLFSSGHLVQGGRCYRPTRSAFTIPADAWLEWNWDNVEITNEERAATENKLNVQQATVVRIRETWGDDALILSDHGKGEIADIIAVSSGENNGSTKKLGLFHCKGAGGAPSLREGDITVVASQAIKSHDWLGHEYIFRELKRRVDRGRAKIEHGASETLDALAGELSRPFHFEICIVQPGISIARAKQAGSDPRLSILLSCYEWFQDTSIRFLVIGSP